MAKKEPTTKAKKTIGAGVKKKNSASLKIVKSQKESKNPKEEPEAKAPPAENPQEDNMGPQPRAQGKLKGVFSLDSEVLKKRLPMVMKTISGTPLLPILSDLLFVGSKSVMRIKSTNADVTVVAKMSYKGDDIKFTVPAKVLSSLVSKSNGMMEFEVFEGLVFLTTGKSVYKLPCLPPNEYPEDQNKGEAVLVFDSGIEFISNFKNALPFASSDTTQKELGGVLLEVEKEIVTLVATDGNIMYHQDLHTTVKGSGRVTIPATMKNFLGKGVLSVYENHISIVNSEHEVSMYLVMSDEPYPNWRGLRPTGDSACTIGVNRKSLIEGLEKLSSVANKSTNSSSLVVNDGQLSISVDDFEMGGKHTISCSQEGTCFEVDLNVNYMITALSSMESEHVDMELRAPNKAVVFSGDQEERLLMPVRIEE